MKLNRLLLPAFLTILTLVAGGCANLNQDGPDYSSPDWQAERVADGPVRNDNGFFDNLSPALRDDVLNSVEINAPVFSTSTCVMRRGKT